MVNSYLKSCFLIFPNYNLGHGLMEMAYNEYINEYYAKIGERWAVGGGPWAGCPPVPPGPEMGTCRRGWSPQAHALSRLPHRPV